MTPAEIASLSRKSRDNLAAEIKDYADKYRPRIIGTYIENGHQVKVIEAGHASGCSCQQFVKPTGRSGSYEL